MPGISLAASMSLVDQLLQQLHALVEPSELPSLVVPNGASPVQPSSISHWQCSTKRSVSGAPSSPKGVSTGAITPEKFAFFAICRSLA